MLDELGFAVQRKRLGLVRMRAAHHHSEPRLTPLILRLLRENTRAPNDTKRGLPFPGGDEVPNTFVRQQPPFVVAEVDDPN